MEATGRVVRSNSLGKANQELKQAEATSAATHSQSCQDFPAILHGFAEKGSPESGVRPREIDSLCMTQACRGVLVDLRCALETWAEHYGVPNEALRAMLADAFLFERAGMAPLSADYFAELANDILAEQAEKDAEGGVE